MTPVDYLFIGLLIGFIAVIVACGGQHKAGWDAGRKAEREKWMNTSDKPGVFVEVEGKHYFAVWFNPNAEIEWQDNGRFPPTNGQEYGE